MGVAQHLARCIEQDLRAMFPALFKSPREKLAIMIAALIEARSCNTMELAARVPIETERTASRYAWVERFLSTETIDDMDVMETMTRDLLLTLSARGQTLIISMDQTSLDSGRAIAMMSARVGERALPCVLVGKKYQGQHIHQRLCAAAGAA